MQPQFTRSTIIPSMRYRDASKAIDWLCKAFGFEKKLVVPADGGSVAHAELVHEGGMVMLGSVAEHDMASVVKQPDEAGGFETQMPCVVVSDADALYHRAKAAGARILLEIEDKPYGGRGFACRDLEGHAWFFGSYDPWANKPLDSSDSSQPRLAPHGFATARPYLYGYSDASGFVKAVFAAEELERVNTGGGFHVELRIGDSIVVLETCDAPPASARPGSVYVYVRDSDAAYRRALKLGATSVAEPADKPYGERTAGVQDRFGNIWWMATLLP